MGRYLDIAREIARVEPELWNLKKPEIQSANARELSKAGWKPKRSFGGVVIWERPDTGCYVSEEIALHLLKRADRLSTGQTEKSTMKTRKRTPCVPGTNYKFPNDFDKQGD